MSSQKTRSDVKEREKKEDKKGSDEKPKKPEENKYDRQLSIFHPKMIKFPLACYLTKKTD